MMIDVWPERSPNVAAAPGVDVIPLGNDPHRPTIVSLEGGVVRRPVAPDADAPQEKPKRAYKRRTKETQNDA